MAVKKGYKQTEVGVIPDDWLVKRIKSVCKLVNGRGFKPFEWKSTGLPIIRIQNLNGSDEFNYFEGSYDKKLEIAPGQLLFAWSGSRGTSFGPHIWDGPLGLLNYHTWKVDVKEDQVNKEFFLYALRQLTSFIEGNAHGASALVHTQKWEMEGFEFPLPPTLPEQEAIAGALSDADAWIESLEQLIAKMRQIKQGAMQELLTGKRRLPGFSGKWETKRLGDLGSFYSGGTPNTSIPEYYGGDIAWITSSDCNAGCVRSVAGRLTSAGVANSATKWVVPGTVLMALYGATAGVVAISKIDATINQAVLAMKLDSQYSSFMFQKLSMMKDWIIQTYTQGGQPNLSGAIVKSIELELPKYDEQVGIATVLSDMDAEIESLESKLAKAREVKQGMMQELLTGRIRLVKSSAVSANPLELSDDR